ncbi:MAG TPA: peptide-binding protein [Symbiobacteriaceae bacterium]|jgi:peptide/nickel transport system substrate-binding protein|nr:peptide-binding protein [Symbiobacteriaceae bacterium]
MNRVRKFPLLMAVAVAASLVLTACGPKQAATPKQEPAATQTAKKPAVGGTMSFRMPKDPDNFNPILSSTSYGSYVHSLVYATLFEFDEKWEPKPYVAESWSASADGLTWTIKIKQGIKFQDGSDLTADDVVFTYKSIMDKDYTGPRASYVKSFKDISAPDKYTVKVDLKEPYAALLNNLNLGILSKKQFESTPVKDFDKNPVTMKPMGAGPYKFVEYVRGQYVTLKRNENWFMNKEIPNAPYIDTITMKIIPEDATAEAALENGEIDVLPTPDPTNVSRLEKDFANKIGLYNYERNGWGYMTLNVTRPHLNDKLVRQALTYGLDRQSIIDSVMDGRAVIPAGPIPNVSWAYDPSIKAAPYDPAKAKQLLEQAGYKMNASGIMEKNGQPLKLTFYASSGSALIEGIGSIARKNWKEIGVDLDVQLMDFNAMMDNYLKPGKFDISFSGFSLGLDPDQMSMFHSSQVNGFNRGRYSNPEVDKLLEAGVKESDPAKRKAIYSDYQKKLVDDAPVILVYANKYTDAGSKKVKGVVNVPGIGMSYMYRWYVNEQ